MVQLINFTPSVHSNADVEWKTFEVMMEADRQLCTTTSKELMKSEDTSSTATASLEQNKWMSTWDTACKTVCKIPKTGMRSLLSGGHIN